MRVIAGLLALCVATPTISREAVSRKGIGSEPAPAGAGPLFASRVR